MKRPALRWLVAVSALALFAVFIHIGSEPVLFAGENATTPLHENPLALQKLSRGYSGEIHPLMEEILDQSGTVTLSIRAGDYEGAARDLRKYAEYTDRLGRLVISLELAESDIAEFQKMSRENAADLQELLNLSERFDTLGGLEVVYREGNETTSLYTVAYEGEALREEARRIRERYAGRSGQVLAASERYQLENDAYRKSVRDVEEVVAGVEEVQEARTETLPPVWTQGACPLELSASPDHVRYGDLVLLEGTLSGFCEGAGEAILYIDSMERGHARIGEDRCFRFPFRIGRISEGRHIAYALARGAISPLVDFRVEAIPVSLELEGAVVGNQTLEVRGRILAGGKGVSGAPVKILLDGVESALSTADHEGTFTAAIRLREGRHLAQAVFDDPSYPLLRSSSPTLEIFAGQRDDQGDPAIQLPVYAMILATSGAGAVFFIRRGRPGMRIPARSIPVAISGMGRDGTGDAGTSAPAPTGLPPPSSDTPEETLKEYLEIRGRGDAGSALRVLYLKLAASIAAQEGIGYHASLTPRELLSIAENHPCAGDLAEFISIYEPVRYGGSPLDARAAERAVSLYLSISGSTGGGDH